MATQCANAYTGALNLEENSIVMAEAFVIRNQLGHYWAKNKSWVDGSDPRVVMRATHEDEAINTLFELSSKDVALRGETLAVELSDKGVPVIEASQIPLPLDPDAALDSDADTEAQDHRAVDPEPELAPETSSQTGT